MSRTAGPGDFCGSQGSHSDLGTMGHVFNWNDFIAAQKESRAWCLCARCFVRLQRNSLVIGAVTGVSHRTQGEGSSSGWQG